MNEERIKELLKNTGREGIDDLIGYMEENGFFTSPCSTRYHLAEEGGLAIHSLNVYENILRIASGLGVINEDQMNSFIVVALLHDLGKMDTPNTSMHIAIANMRSDLMGRVQ